MNEPLVEYRVMNGADQFKPKVVGLAPEDSNMILVVFAPGKAALVPKNPETVARLRSLNCDCSALRGLNINESTIVPTGTDAGSTASGSTSGGDGVDWAKVVQFTTDLLAKINWKNLFNGEEKRTKDQLDKFRSENAFQLYPRLHEGGPWRPVGFGNLNTMTLDELRYFIEWRMPMYKKQMAHKDWGTAKQQVIDRFNRIADIMKDTAIEVYKAKAGCYTHSGIYDDIVTASNGSSTITPFSSTIRPFQENCAGTGNTDGSIDLYTPSKGGGDTDNSGKNGAYTASFGGPLTWLALLGLAGGAIYNHKRTKEKETNAPKGPNKPAQKVVL